MNPLNLGLEAWGYTNEPVKLGVGSNGYSSRLLTLYNLNVIINNVVPVGSC